MWDKFWEVAAEWGMKWVFPPFIAFLILLVVVGLPVCILGASGCFGGSRQFVCQHQPHMGACKVQVTTYYYNAGTKTMMPIESPCGCIADHGAVVLEKH